MSSKSIYRKIWKEYHNQDIPKGWHIHHIDGNHNNNNPENLMCVSPHVHWCIHFLQGDPIALKGKFIQKAEEMGKLGGQKSTYTRNLKHKKILQDLIRKNILSKNIKSFKGKKHTEKTKEILASYRRGKKMSEETKKKISEAIKNKYKNG